MTAAIYANPKSTVLQPLNPDLLRKTQHDIHGAMHVVTGLSDVLALSAPLTSSQKEIALTLKKNAEYTLALIDSLFDHLKAAEVPDKGSALIKFSLLQKIEDSYSRKS